MATLAPNITVREGSIEEVVFLSKTIPEFINPHPAEEYIRRLSDILHLILVVEYAGHLAGFKVGYAKDKECFYSWMGAILPQYRQFGLAKAMATIQEDWARHHGFQYIQFKTRNRLKAMLHFALGNGFDIIAVEPKAQLDEYRILLQKNL